MASESAQGTFNLWTIVGPLVGAYAGYYLRGSEVRRAETMARLDDICSEANLIISASMKYWVKNRSVLYASGEENEDHKANDHEADDMQIEAEILGRLHLLNVRIVSLAKRIGPDEQMLLDDKLVKLRQVITGGDFKDTKRPANPQKIQETFVAAGDLTDTARLIGLRNLQKGAIHMISVPFRKVWRYINRKWRKNT